MNRIYKSLFNRRLGIWQVASELARGAGKTSATVCKSLVALVLGILAGTTMADETIDGGQTVTVPGDHASPWDIGGGSTHFYVGDVTDGTLNIEAGGKVISYASWIGDGSGATGTVNVKGVGATWESAGVIYVGNFGNGELNIENGGKVSTSISYVGILAGSTGKVNVTGTDSSLIISPSNFQIGNSGNGTVTIDNGGTVRSNSMLLAKDISGSGTLNLNATGSVRGVLETGYINKGLGAASFNWNGGILRATGNESNFLRNLSSADVIIGSGGAYFDTNAYNVGLNAASLGGSGDFTKLGAGTLTLNGSSSGVLSQLKVEEGTLTLAGNIGSTSGLIDYVGGDMSKTASVKVEGATSRWDNSGALTVASSGTGTLLIANGGVVSNVKGDIAYDVGSNGTVIVTGANSFWTNSASLDVGKYGTGTLNVENGGTVTNTYGLIATVTGSTGTATVTGTNSNWFNSGILSVGFGGSGTLNIDDGGAVHSLRTAFGSAGGSGTLNLDGNSGSRGLLSTGYVSVVSGNATFNWNGGILQATGNEANYLQGFAANGVTITSRGAFFDTQNYDVGIQTAGVLAGSGGLTKQGSGTLSIAGSNTYAGDTSISNGTLKFDSYTQSGSQTLGIGATSSSVYGKLQVVNAANFQPNANIYVDVVSPLAPALAVGNTLAGVITAGTLNANGFNVTDNSALFNFRAFQNTNSVDLRVVSNSATGIRDAVTEQGHWSALGAADVLDTQLANGASADMGTVINALGQLPNNRDVSRAAMQTLPLISGTQAIQGTLSTFQKLIQNRNSGMASATGLSSGDGLSNKNAWGKVFGSRAEQDNRSGTAGFTADTWGLALGADAETSPGTRFGVAYGYAKTSVDGNTDMSGTAQRANIDSHVISAYGSKNIGSNRTFSFQGDIGLNDSKSTRQIDFGGLNRTARADYRTYSAHVGAAIAQAFELSEKTTLTPGLRADYSWLKSQGYSETGANALNLNVNSQKTDAFVLGADAQLQHRYSAKSRLDVNLGIGYDTVNKRGNIVAAYAGAPGQAFVTTGIDHSPWLLRGGVAYSLATNNGTEIMLRYDAEGRSDYLNHTASVRANWAF